MKPGLAARSWEGLWTPCVMLPAAGLLSAFLLVPVGASAEGRAVKSRVAPIYPEVAKRLRISGPVRLEATIGADGRVANIKIVSGNHMLSEAAEEAVRKWRFAPARAQSKEELTVNFDLKE